MSKRPAPVEDGKAEGTPSKPTLSFVIEVGEEQPRRFRIAPGKRAVKIGRGPKNDIVLGLSGISAHHLDLLAVDSADGPTLAVRDVSTNGTCLVAGPGEPPLKLAKDTEIEVLNSSFLLLPFKVKDSEGKSPEDLRVTMKVTLCDKGPKKEKKDKSSKLVRDAKKKSAKEKKKANDAAAKEMLARCKAFAEEMEKKKQADAKPPSAGVSDPRTAPAPPPKPQTETVRPTLPHVPQHPQAGAAIQPGASMQQQPGAPMQQQPQQGAMPVSNAAMQMHMYQQYLQQQAAAFRPPLGMPMQHMQPMQHMAAQFPYQQQHHHPGMAPQVQQHVQPAHRPPMPQQSGWRPLPPQGLQVPVGHAPPPAARMPLPAAAQGPPAQWR